MPDYKQPRITSAQLLKAIRRAGYSEIRRSGSHVRLGSADGLRKITVPHHSGMTLKPKTLHAILVAAGITAEQLRMLL